MKASSKVYIAGHTGLVGSAILRNLERRNYTNIVVRTSRQLDLTDAHAVSAFFQEEKPQYVFLAAAKVGGIQANNNYSADFIRVNLQIQTNVIDAAYKSGVKKLLFLSSSCCYPKHCPQPMLERHLLSGYLEPTNEAYAIAKLSGTLMCKSYNKQFGTNFIVAIPTNLYGPNDTFDVNNSHVIPALLCKFHYAKISNGKEVVLWGSGNPKREFLYIDDLAEALILCMTKYNASVDNLDEYLINIGAGTDISVKDLVEMVQEVVGYQGKIVWDATKPDGTPRKLLGINKIQNLGWNPSTPLRLGLETTYRWYTSSITLP